MVETRNCDVVIVGAGPAGMTAVFMHHGPV